MRFTEFKDLSEATLSFGSYSPNRGTYWNNLISLIDQGSPIRINSSGDDSIIVKNPKKIVSAMQSIWDGASELTPGIVGQIKSIAFPTTDGRVIPISKIFKSPEIKGKSTDYNVGDIGEIALGVAAAARFNKLGEAIDLYDFVEIASNLSVTTERGRAAALANFNAQVNHGTGKIDNLKLIVRAASRSITAFISFMEDPGITPKDVQGTILSAIKYANRAEKLVKGVEITARDKRSNTIEIISDGTGNQKGTKADLIMSIDGTRINLLSAKAGTSQLGQATGHDWNKPLTFFKTLFDVDVSQFKKNWGATNEEHISTLHQIWEKVAAKIKKATAGDSTIKEAALVKQIANGIMRYSNDVGDNGEIVIIDIVKLSTMPGSPGYKLMRIDTRLQDALDKTALTTKVNRTAEGYASGVQVHGVLPNGKRALLINARSYHSPAGNTVRTIIEGGPLLDELAVVTEPDLQTVTPVPKVAATKKATPKKSSVAPKEPVAVPEPAVDEPVELGPDELADFSQT